MAVPKPYGGAATAEKKIPAPQTKMSAAPSTPAPSVPAPATDQYTKFGGRDAYVTSQNQRWMQANNSNDTDLMGRLQADAKQHGYELKPYTPPPPIPASSTTPPSATTAPAETPMSAPRPNIPAPTATPAPAASPEYVNWRARMEGALAQYQALASQPFQYDAEKDEGYQAMRTLSQQRAKGATQAALEEMNARGILGSSMTAAQLAEIQQNAEQEALAYLPQFRNEARQDYRDRLARAAEMLQFTAGRGDVAYDRAYQEGRDARSDFVTDRSFDRGVLESDRSFDRGVLESDRSFDRGVLESDRSFDRGVLESDRAFDEGVRQFDQTFDLQERQFQENIRQFGVDRALQEAGMQQAAEQFAASQGLQWAQLSQRQKEFVANEAFREREFTLQQLRADRAYNDQRIDANRQYELDVRREDRLLGESQAPAASSPIDPIYERALELASKDQRFSYMDNAQRQQLIDFYASQLNPGPTYGPPRQALTDEELLQYLR